MYYGNEEDKRNHTEERIKALRECASAIPHVKKIIQQMDGKVLNIRLKKALNEGQEGRYSYRIANNWMYIDYYPICNRTTINQILACYKLPELEEGKQQRINAKEIIKDLNEHYSRLNLQAAKLQEALESIDTTREMIRQAVKQLNSLVDKIPYEIRDTYNLPQTIYTQF